MSTKKVKKFRSKRGWLESQHESGSWYKVDASLWNDEVSLTLADCYRTITWEFGRPGSKRAEKKIKKIKSIIDELHNHLVISDKEKESKPKTKKKRQQNATIHRLPRVVRS